MKRYALLVVMAMGCMVCAQPAHRDTVHYGDPWYAFNTLPSLDTIDYFEYFIPPHQTATCNYWGAFHPYPIANHVIYGIAVTVDSMPIYDSKTVLSCLQEIACHSMFPGAEGTMLYVLDSIHGEDTIQTWNAPLVKECNFEYYYFSAGDGSEGKLSEAFNCYEFYFDTPIVLEKPEGTDSTSIPDTVFIGGYRHGCSDTVNRYHYGKDLSYSQRWVTIQGSRVALPYMAGGLQTWPSHAWGMVFPIVGLRCSSPDGLAVEQDGTGGWFARWREDEDADVFQLSVCTDTTPPDSGNIITVTGVSATLASLDSTTSVYLRKQCVFTTWSRSDTVWSDWSEPLRIGTPAGIDAPATGVQLSVLPNPASGTVALSHGAEHGEVALLDIQGRTLLTQPASQRTLDVSALPAGTYLMRLTTPEGTAVKKLVVRR